MNEFRKRLNLVKNAIDIEAITAGKRFRLNKINSTLFNLENILKIACEIEAQNEKSYEIHACINVFVDVWNKYAGKSYGPVTKEKINAALKAAGGFSANIHWKYGSIQELTFYRNTRNYSFSIYESSNIILLSKDNKIHATTKEEMLKICSQFGNLDAYNVLDTLTAIRFEYFEYNEIKKAFIEKQTALANVAKSFNDNKHIFFDTSKFDCLLTDDFHTAAAPVFNAETICTISKDFKKIFDKAGSRERYALENGNIKNSRYMFDCYGNKTSEYNGLMQFVYGEKETYQDANGATFDVNRNAWIN